MSVNKHAALQEWFSACPLLTDAAAFDFLRERNGGVSISPVSGEAWVRRFVRGAGWKRYDFAVQVMLAASETTDGVNADNMYLLQTWQTWLDGQNRVKSFPDFGPDCSDYSLENLSNMPQMAQRYGSGYAKYQFMARLNYFDNGGNT